MSQHSPKTLYEISLDVFCEYLYNWSQPPLGSRRQDDNPALQRLMSVENHEPINLIFSSFHARTPQWMLSSRPSSTDNLAAYNHFDDKISSFKKSCHNLMSTFFGRKSLESLEKENIRQFAPASNLLYRISENICQDIIKHFQCQYKMNDRTLSFPLFDGDVNTIINFQVEDATHLTVEGLRALKKHNLVRIKMARLTNVTITELINNLSPWSIWNLESFCVPHCSLTRFNKICIILSLTRLTNLMHLDVSYTSFNNQCLEIITDHLTNLRSLDLTSTKITILKPLTKLVRLTRLNLHNVALTCKDEPILGDLTNLESLDISDERFPDPMPDMKDQLVTFFHKFSQMERLTELDISGRRVLSQLVCSLVKHRISMHKKNPEFRPLRFLGLMLSEFSFNQMYEFDLRTKGMLRITGIGKLIHIIHSLIHYKHRPFFIQQALVCLCQYTFSDNNVDEMVVPFPPDEIDLNNLQDYHNDNENDGLYEYDDQMDSFEILAAESRLHPDEIQPYRAALVQLVVDIMESHISNGHLILISSGNLYNLTKNNPHLHPYVLRSVVRICIRTMQHYSTDYKIIKNILLTLCSDRILQDISFDRYTCIRLVMDTLFAFRELSINRLALGICAILAAKIPTVENALMGSQSVYLKRLLDLVQESYCVRTQNNEIILKLSLSALWNFTDEAPKTCETFIKHNGIKLYVDTLTLYEEKSNIETKILGLLNNIAEVLYLRKHLVQDKLLSQLRKLIYSDQINVSYFAIGILAQLASDPNLDWDEIEDFDLDEVLQQMSNQIQSWSNPSFEMVAYRSFEPLMSLLLNDRHSSIGLWALWAIHHVCTKNPNKYSRMLHDEKCIQTIILILKQRLLDKYQIESSQLCKQLSQRLIDLVTVADDEFQVLSKAVTDWNCHSIHEWNILVEPRKSGQYKKNIGDKNNNNINYECLLKDDKIGDALQKIIEDEDNGKYCGMNMHTISKHKVQDVENEINDYDEVDCGKNFRRQHNHHLKMENCDCFLKHYLDHDPFLRLPSIILKSFQCFSPIPLNLDVC